MIGITREEYLEAVQTAGELTEETWRAAMLVEARTQTQLLSKIAAGLEAAQSRFLPKFPIPGGLRR